jgi:hypothetical protein
MGHRRGDQYPPERPAPGFSLNRPTTCGWVRSGPTPPTSTPSSERERQLFRLGNTFRSIASVRAGEHEAHRPARGLRATVLQAESAAAAGLFYSTSQAPLRSTGRAFSASFNYSLSRRRPEPGVGSPTTRAWASAPASPHALLGAVLVTQYNITDNEFESHVVRLSGTCTNGGRASTSLGTRMAISPSISDLPDRPAGSQVRLRSDNVRGMIVPCLGQLQAGGSGAGRQVKAHHHNLSPRRCPAARRLACRLAWVLHLTPTNPHGDIVCAAGGYPPGSAGGLLE